MEKVYLEFDAGVPRYTCTTCSHCNSTMGVSLCSVKDRGCCFYYPKFELIDLQRMSKTLDGVQTIKLIIQNPGTIVYHYYIHAKGIFDKEAYNKYGENDWVQNQGIDDNTIFFRACPFVKGRYGCTLPPRFRTIICNFFICNEILSATDAIGDLDRYMKERSRYAGWIKWENAGLEHLLAENGLDLVDSFDETIDLLSNTPMDEYEFPDLEPVFMNTLPHKRGA